MMFAGFDIAPRSALAAPSDPFVMKAQSAAIMVVSILSVLGGGWMVASFFVFSNLRSFRHQLILGLALSDCIMALNFLLSSSMNVAGRWIGAPEQAQFCSFNGYMTQVFVIQTDYWVFVIAVYTFFVLTDQKRCSNWIQNHPLVPWVLPWVLSVLWATVGLLVTGYGDIGAWCWFTSDEVRLLVNFVPRWTIIAIMFVMYARLYFLLFRAHRRLLSLGDSSSGNPSGGGSGGASGSGSRQPGSGGVSGGGAAVPARHTRKLKRLARLMLLYPLAYAIVWSLPTSIRIYQASSGKPAPWQLQTVDKACIVLQGLVDAIIYGITESSLASWRNLLFPGRFPVVNGAGLGGPGALGYGNLSGTGQKRWSSAVAGGGGGKKGEEGLVGGSSRPSTTEGTDLEGGRSVEALSEGTTVGEETGRGIELGKVKTSVGGGEEMGGIRRTVKIEVVTTSNGGGRGGGAQDGLQRPLKAYFPEEGHGSFLDV